MFTFAKRTPIVSALALWASLAGPAQSLNPAGHLYGELSGIAAGEFSLELVDDQTHATIARSFAGWDGRFEFRSVPFGTYTLRILGSDSRIVSEETLMFTGTEFVRVRLPEPSAAQRGPGGLVSAEQLRHPVSKKGMRILDRARKVSQQGKHEEAMAELRKALAEPAAAPYAHSMLGQEYMRMGKLAEALPELEQGVALLPKDAINHSNYGYALCLARQCGRGEQEIRKSLELDPNSLVARFLLGVILLDKGSRDSEALMNLKFAAARNFRSAHGVLAVYYQRTGDKQAARKELAAYLGALNVDSPAAQQWLDRATEVSSQTGVFPIK
jgi:Tfp pilus assembly protein PilF